MCKHCCLAPDPVTTLMIFWAGQLPQLFPLLGVPGVSLPRRCCPSQVMTAACGYSFPCPAQPTHYHWSQWLGGPGPAWCCVLLPLDRQTGADNDGGWWPLSQSRILPFVQSVRRNIPLWCLCWSVIQLPWFIGHLAARDATHVTLHQTLPTHWEISEISTAHNTGGPGTVAGWRWAGDNGLFWTVTSTGKCRDRVRSQVLMTHP